MAKVIREREGTYKMTVSYKGLWKVLREKGLKKQNLVDDLKLSSATVAKMGKGEPVAFSVMDRLCEYLNCDVNEIIRLESRKNGR